MKRREFLKLAAAGVPLGETALLGNVGILRHGRKLLWDGRHITNDAVSERRRDAEVEIFASRRLCVFALNNMW